MSDQVNEVSSAPVAEGQVSQEVEAQESTQEAVAQDAESVLTDPSASKAEKVEAKKMLKKLKIKFNGKELEESLPFEIPDSDEAREYMTRQLQMSKLAQSKSQDYSNLEKEVKQFIDLLKKDPRRVLSDPTIGLDVKEFAAKILEEEIENSKKSPEQIQREQLEAELKALKEEAKKKDEEFKSKEFERLQAQEFERYDTQISRALETSGLPKSPYVVKKIADYMLMGIQQGYDVSAEDVLPLVREEIQTDIKEMFSLMPDEVVESIIGKDIFTRIRKKNVQKAKEKSVTPATVRSAIKDIGQSSKQELKAAEPKKTIKELFGV